MTTITVDRPTLVAAFKRVLPHIAQRGDNVPVLETVRVEVRGAYLILTGTDRYSLAQSRVPLREGAEPFKALVEGAKVKSILTALKGSGPVDLTFSEDFSEVRLQGFDVSAEDVQAEQFPPVDKLFPSKLRPVEGLETGLLLNVFQLKKLTALPQLKDDKYATPSFWIEDKGHRDGVVRTIIVVFGDHTRVALVPAKASTVQGEAVLDAYSSWS